MPRHLQYTRTDEGDDFVPATQTIASFTAEEGRVTVRIVQDEVGEYLEVMRANIIAEITLDRQEALTLLEFLKRNLQR